ncbi:hypothetical protein [Streptomyces sp. NRRL B-3229]|uniref:hypothetical protein n=1 Tax=Streptomyces sp. NRRL B-3229 TaxID=1463836 RepID=UPI0004BFB753|nr:hypothetical protein [Streptomyces sp. NRRL B-3229]
MRKTSRTRAVLAAASLAAAAALATAAPVGAQPAQVLQATQSSTVYAWIDGWGGGTVTSRPAGISCHTTAWDPYSSEEPPPNSTGPCSASFPVGTTVTFTATPDPGSAVNGGPDPASLTVRSGYNAVWAMFCPTDGLCSAG